MIQNMNDQLLDACREENLNFEKIESLLKQGANPNGKVGQKPRQNFLFNELYDYLHGDDQFPKLTKLLLDYGLDLDNPEVPYDDDNGVHPLWNFSFFSDGDADLEVLRLLLDNGLSAESASKCWDHILLDSLHIYGKLEDDFCYEMFYQEIQKILLFASYLHILNESEDLRNIIWYNKNNYDVERFRNWRDFRFEVDTSHCTKEPEIYRSVVTVIEKKTNKAVWKLGFGIASEDIS